MVVRADDDHGFPDRSRDGQVTIRRARGVHGPRAGCGGIAGAGLAMRGLVARNRPDGGVRHADRVGRRRGRHPIEALATAADPRPAHSNPLANTGSAGGGTTTASGKHCDGGGLPRRSQLKFGTT